VLAAAALATRSAAWASCALTTQRQVWREGHERRAASSQAIRLSMPV
jgi:hypothetical protein